MTLEEKLEEAVEDYINNKVDYNITAFQHTEVPALIDLANDSFQAGFRYALSICQQEIADACRRQRHECALVYEDTTKEDERYQETYYRILNAPSPLKKLK